MSPPRCPSRLTQILVVIGPTVWTPIPDTQTHRQTDRQTHNRRLYIEGQVWQFDAMPNGLALAPRKFTKLLKPVFATLRQKGHISTAFLDDSLLLAKTHETCVQNITETVQLLRSLGFVIHPDKSVFQPSHSIPSVLGYAN